MPRSSQWSKTLIKDIIDLWDTDVFIDDDGIEYTNIKPEETLQHLHSVYGYDEYIDEDRKEALKKSLRSTIKNIWQKHREQLKKDTEYEIKSLLMLQVHWHDVQAIVGCGILESTLPKLLQIKRRLDIEFKSNTPKQTHSDLYHQQWIMSYLPELDPYENAFDILRFADHCSLIDFIADQNNTKPDYSEVIDYLMFKPWLSEEHLIQWQEAKSQKGSQDTYIELLSEIEKPIVMFSLRGCLYWFIKMYRNEPWKLPSQMIESFFGEFPILSPNEKGSVQIMMETLIGRYVVKATNLLYANPSTNPNAPTMKQLNLKWEELEPEQQKAFNDLDEWIRNGYRQSTD